MKKKGQMSITQALILGLFNKPKTIADIDGGPQERMMIMRLAELGWLEEKGFRPSVRDPSRGARAFQISKEGRTALRQCINQLTDDIGVIESEMGWIK